MSVTVLVPLDGSASAEHALPAAVALAGRHAGIVQLCRVCVPSATGGGLSRRVERDWARAHTYLRAVRDRLVGALGVRVRSAVRVGPAAESVLWEAALVGADLIALTTHGHGDSGPCWIGATADAIVHRADCAVLLLPPTRGGVEWDAGASRRILLPVERVLDAEASVGQLALLASAATRFFALPLRGSAPSDAAAEPARPSPEPAAHPGIRPEAAHAAVSAEARRAGVEPVRPKPYAPAPAVVLAARELGADLVAFVLPAKVGTHPQELDPLVERLVRMAPLPLLLHRPSVRRPLDLPALGLPAADEPRARRTEH